jgi:hypothetical protein
MNPSRQSMNSKLVNLEKLSLKFSGSSNTSRRAYRVVL